MNVTVFAQFTASKTGKTGLSPTINVYQCTRAVPPVVTTLVSGGSAIEIGNGLYYYQITGIDPTVDDYAFAFLTSDATVDQQQIPGLITESAALVGAYATNQDPATLVLGATATSWNAPGTIGNKINSAASSGDPWTTALPGSYAPGEAGYILGNGVQLAANGMDNVLVASGITPSASLVNDAGAQLTHINARQALAITFTMAAARSSGAVLGNSQVLFVTPDGEVRIDGYVDIYGNRSQVIVKVPT